MDVYDFADAMCHLNTAIAKYLDAKKARDYCRQGHLPLPDDVIITIGNVLEERIDQCEKQIIELATKLVDRQEETPVKKKK